MKRRSNRLLIHIYWGHDNVPEAEEIKMLAQYVSNLFTFYLPVINTQLKKIVIEFDLDSSLPTIDYLIDSKIMTVYKSFDFSNWQREENKLQSMFNLASEALKAAFEELEIPSILIVETVEEIERNGLELNVEICKTPIFNKEKKIRAILLAEYKIDYVIIVLIFSFNDGDSRRVPLFKTFPHYFIYDQLIKKLKWINNNKVEIENNSGELKINVEVNGKVIPIYESKDRDVDGIIEEIKFLTKEVYFKV